MRPKTDEHEKLNHGVRVRLTDAEKRILIMRCREEGYRNLSEFSRAKLVKKREVRKVEVSDEFLEAVKKLDHDLCKIGANLNQLAKAINTNAVYGFDEHDRKLLGQILSKLKDCFKTFEGLVHLME
ncbi:plasmid mobilization relaxosome protein MobC [Marinifilum sp. D714]|uniref:plasmid mobilization protein n=1 Tax=Marinifilum sp. D714 TaxID=2937523 RepID=UPI0027C55444|nr:plasmid mobilization relaxosome protein MobC [Marinifilum sp. D714]MDQ2178563.1 MobC family plasmid mobilization relaxosome protein [Marinifilum sp. D714]